MLESIKQDFSNLVELFQAEKNPWVRSEIDRNNIRIMHFISIFVAIMEGVTLIFLLANYKIYSRESLITSTFSLSYSTIICVIVAILTRKKNQKQISHNRATAILVFFFLALSSWGIFVDAWHFAREKQMLTFYIVLFCFVCFVVIQPLIGLTLVAVVNLAFVIVISCIPMPNSMDYVNHTLFVLIEVLGIVLNYRIRRSGLIEQEKLAEANNLLGYVAQQDALTGLKNRYSLQLDGRMIKDETIYAMMADVDLFKNFNDTYGHQVGDIVLKEISDSLLKVFSPEECYRYGGDEFLILARSDSEEEFIQKIKEWESEVSKIQHVEIPVTVGVSYGYEYGKVNDVEDLDKLIRTADQKLYDQKRNKRR